MFVLHDFHLFAERKKQTLLYSLLDLQQSSKQQVVVVGITDRLDVSSNLEKRVSSRYVGEIRSCEVESS